MTKRKIEKRSEITRVNKLKKDYEKRKLERELYGVRAEPVPSPIKIMEEVKSEEDPTSYKQWYAKDCVHVLVSKECGFWSRLKICFNIMRGKN